jgi:hypothetical protein
MSSPEEVDETGEEPVRFLESPRSQGSRPSCGPEISPRALDHNAASSVTRSHKAPAGAAQPRCRKLLNGLPRARGAEIEAYHQRAAWRRVLRCCSAAISS